MGCNPKVASCLLLVPQPPPDATMSVHLLNYQIPLQWPQLRRSREQVSVFFRKVRLNVHWGSASAPSQTPAIPSMVLPPLATTSPPRVASISFCHDLWDPPLFWDFFRMGLCIKRETVAFSSQLSQQNAVGTIKRICPL